MTAANPPATQPGVVSRGTAWALRLRGSVTSILARFINAMSPRSLSRFVRTHNHRHDWHMHAFKMPLPEGGTYYQLRCSRPTCLKRRGDRRYTVAKITEPSVMYTVKIPLRLVAALDERAQRAEISPVDYINRMVRHDLSR